jgi:DNA-binding transcriptional ArsR family regulator
MSTPRRSSLADRRALRHRAPVFAALGDETRLALVAQLSSGAPRSIAQLTEGSRLTRQAITKHLRVLEGAGLVHCARHGRESRYELEPHSLDDARRFLEEVSAQWDQALERLKVFVEEES